MDKYYPPRPKASCPIRAYLRKWDSSSELNFSTAIEKAYIITAPRLHRWSLRNRPLVHSCYECCHARQPTITAMHTVLCYRHVIHANDNTLEKNLKSVENVTGFPKKAIPSTLGHNLKTSRFSSE